MFVNIFKFIYSFFISYLSDKVPLKYLIVFTNLLTVGAFYYLLNQINTNEIVIGIKFQIGLVATNAICTGTMLVCAIMNFK